eukprot:865893-Prymnesium_polylepis.2
MEGRARAAGPPETCGPSCCSRSRTQRFRDHTSARRYQNSVASALARLGALKSAEEYTIVIGALCRARDPIRCVGLLRSVERSKLNEHACNAAISACIGSSRWRTALEVLEMMPRDMPTVTTYSLAVRACAKANRLVEARAIIGAIDVSGLEPQQLERASVTVQAAYQAAIEAAARLGRRREARSLLEKLREQPIQPNVYGGRLLEPQQG